MKRWVLSLGLFLVTAALPAFARADGEAGLVIDYGDGRVETYCVAFEGDRITGDQLLERAGVDVNQFSGMVCAIEGVGCRHRGNFPSCHCQCEDLADCTYWAYFVQRNNGGWVRSSLGFLSQVARHGDLHGWRWGKGTAEAATAPPSFTFAEICGHPATTPTTAPSSEAPASPPADVTATTAPGMPAPADTAVPTTAPITAAPSFTGEFTPVPSSPPMTPGLGHTETALSSPSELADTREEEGGRVPVARLAAFGAIATLLAGATIAASFVRRRHRDGSH